MISKQILDSWFTYHPPTDEQKLKYTAIRAHEGKFGRVLAAALVAIKEQNKDPDFESITTACRESADAINEHAPDSADKSAAIRCVRLAWIAANEALLSAARKDDPTITMALAHGAIMDFTRARWQACAAIACEE